MDKRWLERYSIRATGRGGAGNANMMESAARDPVTSAIDRDRKKAN